MTLSLLGGSFVYFLSGGNEIADDAEKLIRFAHMPFVLLGDYRAAGLNDMWGSFPPLMPLAFGVLVAPWLAVTGSEFWGIRMAVLSWSVVALVVLHLILERETGTSAHARRVSLLVFAVLPSVVGAIAFIPQEEIYVSIYCLALYRLAKLRKWVWVAVVLFLAFFAAKYFILALALPIALASERPVRHFVLWTGAVGAALAGYLAYHHFVHGLHPIVSYVIEPGWSVSVWALVWELGAKMDLRLMRVLSLALVAVAILAFCVVARRRRLPLAFAMAGTLYITLLGLSITAPAYVLWGVPLVVICLAGMRQARHRVATVALLVAWGVGEWGANFFRGVRLALETERAAGKVAIASLTEGLLGSDFPYQPVQLACIAVAVASGLGQLWILWRAGTPDHGPSTRDPMRQEV